MRPANTPARLAVLLSGQGSTWAALDQACREGRCAATTVAVFSNRARAEGLRLAQERGLPARSFSQQAFPDRASQEQALGDAIEASGADWVILAGYMRILGQAFVGRFRGRMLNTHPSLLPRYRGLDTYQRALDAGEHEHGCSIHFVTEALDGGPVIAQAEVPILPGDTAAELETRTKARERKLYPMVVDLAARNRLRMTEDGIRLDDRPLTRPLRLAWDKETLE